MTVAEVLPGIWRTSTSVVSGPYTLSTNAYLVVDEGEGLLIDTAWWRDDDSDHLEQLLSQIAIDRTTVRHMFLTHAHRDHSGFVNFLEQRTGATPVIHESERPTISSLNSYQGLPNEAAVVAWYQGFGVPEAKALQIVRTKLPDNPFDPSRARWVGDGDLLRVGGRTFEVVYVPGHTPGHACLVEHATGVVFSGDALLPRGHGNPHVTLRAFTPHDPLTDYVDGLLRLQDRAQGATVCLPGHGPAVVDVPALVTAHLKYVESKLGTALAAVTTEPATAYEIIARMEWRGGTSAFEDLEADALFLSFADGMARLRRLATLGIIAEAPVHGAEGYVLQS